MGSLRINKVVYQGDKFYFESKEFIENIVIVEGYNGTGKSTFCNLIYFALGGEVQIFRKNNDTRHDEVTSDTDNYVDLYVSISGKNYLLRRYFNDNDIAVIPYKRVIEKVFSNENPPRVVSEVVKFEISEQGSKIFPVNRHGDNLIFSDWILNELGISVVELYQGYKTFKINFTDLMRLIYHDQQPNPENIFKKPDTKSVYVSDSEIVRNAIFELLVGKSYSEYYDAIAEEKRLAGERAVAREVVSEYKLLADKLRKNGEAKNASFLQAEIREKENQVGRLHAARLAFKRNRNDPGIINQNIDRCKNELVEAELELSQLKEELIAGLDERFKLKIVREETATEIMRIEKVIFSHDQLNLFSSETCPYCLSPVSRAAGHCVCGASIEEQQYERFFYTSQEYKDILKAKLKTLDTIKVAYEDCDREVSELKAGITSQENNIRMLRANLTSLLASVGDPVDVNSLNEIDDRILEVREDISDLNRLLEIESKLDGYQRYYEDINAQAKAAELKRKEYEAKAKQDIISKVYAFSKKYDELMKDTLPECRSATISVDNYLPRINEGLYRETSALVSIRLMYYITLMHLSLSDESVTFPRFLLIDTPETAGIELELLRNCIKKLEELKNYGVDFQVIITTGVGKYPAELVSNRVLFMPVKTQEHMLLKERTI